MLLEFQRNLAAAIDAPAHGPLRVYRNTVLSGCIDALGANYPVVAQLLGRQMFEAVAAEFVAQCPPQTPVLALYGRRFPEWLEDQSWVADLAYLSDVARIDRLFTESLFAADAECLTTEDLQGCGDWEELVLLLHPATRFDWLATPAMTIWLSHREPIAGDLDIDWHSEGALFSRPDTVVHPMALGRAAHRFLFGIRRGESIAAAGIATAQSFPATDIGFLFTSLVNAGVFAAFSHRSPQ